jgi:hypothetical protein
VLSRYDRMEQIKDVEGVAALRAELDRARSDPDVVGWRYWRLVEPAGVARAICASCGEPYQQGRVTDRECRCGLVHVEHWCHRCQAAYVDPPHDEGCGAIPVDTEAINERYRRRRWRRAG